MKTRTIMALCLALLACTAGMPRFTCFGCRQSDLTPAKARLFRAAIKAAQTDSPDAWGVDPLDGARTVVTTNGVAAFFICYETEKLLGSVIGKNAVRYQNATQAQKDAWWAAHYPQVTNRLAQLDAALGIPSFRYRFTDTINWAELGLAKPVETE